MLSMNVEERLVQGLEYLFFGDTVLIIDISLLMEPDIFSHIFPKEVSMYKFFCMLILLFTRETVRFIALEGIRQTDFSYI